jgi:hypothetical protein
MFLNLCLVLQDTDLNDIYNHKLKTKKWLNFEQDLIIFEDDTLLLRYTFTDLATPLTSNMGFWWGAVTSSGFP